MRDRIKEHEQDIRFARTQTSVVSEHANNIGHFTLTTGINRDSGIEIPEAWIPTIKKHSNSRTVRQRIADGTVYQNSEDRNSPITAAENQPITAEHPA